MCEWGSELFAAKLGVWRAIVAQLERGGERQAGFCAHRGLGLSAFQYWLYRGRREQEGGTEACLALRQVLVSVSTALTIRVARAPSGGERQNRSPLWAAQPSRNSKALRPREEAKARLYSELSRIRVVTRRR